MVERIILIFLLFLFACQSSQKSKQLNLIIEKQNSPTTNSLRGISVVDSNVVWLSGANGTILKTENGGKKWKLISAPDQDSLDYRDVHAFSAEEAIVVSAGFPSRVYKTKNAGETWILVHENKDSTAFMNSVHFKNKKQGIIFGDRLGDCHLILQTLDAGQSWKRISCVNMPKPLNSENGFAASGSCITTSRKGSYVIGLGGEKSRVFTSPKGNVWQANNTNFGGGKSSRGIYSIAQGGTSIVAVGGDYTKVDSSYQVVISKDQGKSWTKGGEVHGYRSIVTYSPILKLWLAAGINGIDLSADEGLSWSKRSDVDVNTAQFSPNSSTLWAAGSKGEIYRISFHIP